MAAVYIWMKAECDSKMPWGRLDAIAGRAGRKFLVGRFFTAEEDDMLRERGFIPLDAVARRGAYGDFPMIAAVDAVKFEAAVWSGEEDVVVMDVDCEYECPAGVEEGREYVIGKENRFVHVRSRAAAVRMAVWFGLRVLPAMLEACEPCLRGSDARLVFALEAELVRRGVEGGELMRALDWVLGRVVGVVPQGRAYDALMLYLLPYQGFGRFFWERQDEVAVLEGAQDRNNTTQYQMEHPQYWDESSPYWGWTRWLPLPAEYGEEVGSAARRVLGGLSDYVVWGMRWQRLGQNGEREVSE